MKIQTSHLKHMQTAIRQYEQDNPEAVAAHKAKHTPMRYRHDVMRAAGLLSFVCDTLYEYMDDTHLDTALRHICKATK